MARKRAPRAHDDIAQAFSIYAPGQRKVDVFRAALAAVKDGSGVLPEGIEITWRWRNAANKPWQSDDFESTVQNSGPKRGGFLKLMARRLEKEAADLPGWRGATREQRSAAGKQAAVTRKRNIALERARKEAWKRSAAAREGWRTRKAAQALKTPKATKTTKRGKRR